MFESGRIGTVVEGGALLHPKPKTYTNEQQRPSTSLLDRANGGRWGGRLGAEEFQSIASRLQWPWSPFPYLKFGLEGAIAAWIRFQRIIECVRQNLNQGRETCTPLLPLLVSRYTSCCPLLDHLSGHIDGDADVSLRGPHQMSSCKWGSGVYTED